MGNSEDVSVIVPTLAELSRSLAIRRCIDSIRRSSCKSLRIIAVINGKRYDSSVVRWLQEQNDVLLIQVPAPSAPAAVLEGRKHVTTPFFSTLDDDDEYLPGATDIKLAAILKNCDIDVVVTNIYRVLDNNKEKLHYTQHHHLAILDLKSIFSECWLHNGNALYRSASIGIEFFQNYHNYVEWTWLAFQLLIAGKKALFLNLPTSRYYASANSLSQSKAYQNAHFPLYERMLASAIPPEIVQLIHRRIGSAYHDESVRALQASDRKTALQFHLKSLLQSGGMRYLLYTRRLFPGWPDGGQ